LVLLVLPAASAAAVKALGVGMAILVPEADNILVYVPSVCTPLAGPAGAGKPENPGSAALLLPLTPPACAAADADRKLFGAAGKCPWEPALPNAGRNPGIVELPNAPYVPKLLGPNGGLGRVLLTGLLGRTLGGKATSLLTSLLLLLLPPVLGCIGGGPSNAATALTANCSLGRSAGMRTDAAGRTRPAGTAGTGTVPAGCMEGAVRTGADRAAAPGNVGGAELPGGVTRRASADPWEKIG
jgi:hypothetical protein